MRRNLLKYLFWNCCFVVKRRCLTIKKSIIFIVLCTMLILYFKIKVHEIEKETAEDEYSNGENYRCEVPHLDPRNPEIMKFIWDTPPIKCRGVNFLEIEGSIVKIREEQKKLYKDLYCNVRDVLRITGRKNKLSRKFTLRGNATYLLRKSDFIYVRCFSGNTTLMNSINVMAGIRHPVSLLKEISWKKVPEDALRLNVLILAFDSVSRSQFLRKMPRSLEYMRKELEVVEFEKYNVLGDGTTAAIIPLMTGGTEWDLPEIGRNSDSASFVDEAYPLIWDEFRRNGYVTSYVEDGAYIGTFYMRFKGFRRMPTHHCMRHFYIQAQALYYINDAYCLGATPRHLVLWNYVAQLFAAYRHKPKFMFAFYSELTHDCVRHNLLGSLDSDFHRLLQALNDDGQLQRTMLVVMGDHGARFSTLRNTTQGKFEERLPFLAVSLPDWFKAAHPDLYGNLKGNAQKLVTTFDLHATLREVLRLDRKDRRGRLGQRAISLFKEIPADRSCYDSEIRSHWCMCLKRLEVPVEDGTVQTLALFAVSEINSLTRELRFKCAELSLDRVYEAAILRTSERILNFKREIDLATPSPQQENNGTRTPKDVVFQIKLSVRPGDALYEVSLSLNVGDGAMAVQDSAISRLNAYAPYVKCLKETELNVVKYCFCTS